MTASEAIEGPEAWHGDALAGDERWRFELEASDIAEIDAALAVVQSRNIAWAEMTRADFPLGGLVAKLDLVAEELENGSGLANLARLPVERYDDEALSHIWFGLGLHLGTPLYQDYRGLLMRDITDERQDTDAVLGQRFHARDGSVFHSSKARTASSGPLRFHTDRADVVGLLCIHQAAAGGISELASSVTVHNEILERRPDLAELLYGVIYRSKLGEEKRGGDEIYALPVFGVRDGKFTSHYSRTYVEAAQEIEEVPRLSQAQWEALDLLAEVAEEISMEMVLEPGDMQFINNHVVYHARTAYEDPAADGERRRLRRIWLAMPNSRALPQDHAVLWRNVEAGAVRGGIGQA